LTAKFIIGIMILLRESIDELGKESEVNPNSLPLHSHL
jgi:hypothetical protein